MAPETADLIAVDPAILHGQAHIRGTRVLVSVVLDCVAAGMTDDEILEEYPTLSLEGIRAATTEKLVEVTQEGDWFVARRLDVELASQGRTKEEAEANLDEAFGLLTDGD